MATNVEYILSLKDQFSSKIDNANKSVNKLESKMSSLKGGMKSMLSGFAMGAGIGVFESLSGAVVSFAQNSIKEFEEAQRISGELQRTLRTVGRESYFEGLINESNDLAVAFRGLYDNDDIIVAQTQLINYGKLTRAEISKLLPVIADLSAKEGIDLSQATEKVINIMAGRGGNVLRQYGLSVKGVGTEHDRLNLILGDFQTKLQGSVDTYATTAQGIQQTNKVLMANIEENLGESFSRIKMKVIPIITDILNGINDIINKKSILQTLKEGEQKTYRNESNNLEIDLQAYTKRGVSEMVARKKVVDFQRGVVNKEIEQQRELAKEYEFKRYLKGSSTSEKNKAMEKQFEAVDRIITLESELKAIDDFSKRKNQIVVNPNAGAEAGGVPKSTLATPSTTTRAVGSNTTRSQATGSKAITINVSIKDLIGVNNMNITNIKDGANKLQDMVVSALTGAVNDFQLIAE